MPRSLCLSSSGSRSRICSAASRARSFRRLIANGVGDRKVASPLCSWPNKLPIPLSRRSARAISNPSSVSTKIRSRSAASSPKSPSRMQYDASAPRPDAAAQLMKLRQSEPLGMLDQHHRSVGDIDADFDHRRRDQHVDFSIAKARMIFSRSSAGTRPWISATTRPANGPAESCSYIVVAALRSVFSDSSITGYTTYAWRPFSVSRATNSSTRSRADSGRSTVVTGCRPAGRSSRVLTSRSP